MRSQEEKNYRFLKGVLRIFWSKPMEQNTGGINIDMDVWGVFIPRLEEAVEAETATLTRKSIEKTVAT